MDGRHRDCLNVASRKLVFGVKIPMDRISPFILSLLAEHSAYLCAFVSFSSFSQQAFLEILLLHPGPLEPQSCLMTFLFQIPAQTTALMFSNSSAPESGWAKLIFFSWSPSSLWSGCLGSGAPLTDLMQCF